jgi:hypothetical protein
MHPSLSNLLAISFETLLYKILYSDVIIISAVDSSAPQLASSTSLPPAEPVKPISNGHTNGILTTQPVEAAYPPIPKKIVPISNKIPQSANLEKRVVQENTSRKPSTTQFIQVLADKVNRPPMKRQRPENLKSLVPDPNKKPGRTIRVEHIMGEDHVVRGQTRTVEVDISSHHYFQKPSEEISQPIVAKEPRCDYIPRPQKAIMPFKAYRGSLSMEKIIMKAVNRDVEEMKDQREVPLDNLI